MGLNRVKVSFTCLQAMIWCQLFFCPETKGQTQSLPEGFSTYRKVYSDQSTEIGEILKDNHIRYIRNYRDGTQERGEIRDGVLEYGKLFRDEQREHFFGKRMNGYDMYSFLGAEDGVDVFQDEIQPYSYQVQFYQGEDVVATEQGTVTFVAEFDDSGNNEVIRHEKVNYIRTSEDEEESGTRFKGETLYRVEYVDSVETGNVLKNGSRSYTRVPRSEENLTNPTYRERVAISPADIIFGVEYKNGVYKTGFIDRDGLKEQTNIYYPNGDEEITTTENGVTTSRKIPFDSDKDGYTQVQLPVISEQVSPFESDDESPTEEEGIRTTLSLKNALQEAYLCPVGS